MGQKKLIKGTNIPVVFLYIIIITLVFVGVLYVYIELWHHEYGHYERIIQRNADDDEEGHILSVVENFSYSDVFDVERFDNGEYEKWANFIDFEVIEHYNSEFERLRDQGARHDVSFTYKAEVYNIDQLNLLYDYIHERDEYTLELFNSSVTFLRIEEYFFPDIIAEFNGTNLAYYNHEFSFQTNFSNVYVVHLFLYYSDGWGSLAGYAVLIDQIVIMNREFQPLFIIIDTNHWIS
ncbi:MAG: hypothetical protein JSV09_12215 [Thermoplasmata archaeon]|nr:MAG: hypothetical protein JSV09_12215 [Thermoplasmata archaeon]